MTHASLFSGIGAAEPAAAWMGWKNLFHFILVTALDGNKKKNYGKAKY